MQCYSRNKAVWTTANEGCRDSLHIFEYLDAVRVFDTKLFCYPTCIDRCAIYISQNIVGRSAIDSVTVQAHDI
eukprot:m.220538 g.220538  ORF g.220538 m.220538 type:complete len:73 (-) comp19167_c2_seq3:98-316(-)